MSNTNNINNSLKRRGSKNDLPFYEAPTGVVTISQIIKEAKEKVIENSTKVSPANSSNSVSLGIVGNQINAGRIIQTNRPFTPKDEKRSLFGSKSIRPVTERPPSSIR